MFLFCDEAEFTFRFKGDNARGYAFAWVAFFRAVFTDTRGTILLYLAGSSRLRSLFFRNTSEEPSQLNADFPLYDACSTDLNGTKCRPTTTQTNVASLGECRAVVRSLSGASKEQALTDDDVEELWQYCAGSLREMERLLAGWELSKGPGMLVIPES